ncbi:MAG: sensor histidine kinase [Leptolyngbya sp. SIOISBB]|nr:sensor histidine kinase [Leptolyngbya sp. SIOISBB]
MYRAAILLQSFVVVLTVATLVLSAAIQENRKANYNLKQANAELEHRVAERTEELSATLGALKKAQVHLVQQEKMSGLGQMVAGIAHEINNPMNFIHGNLQHLNGYTRDLLAFLNLYETQYPGPHAEIQALADEIDIDFLKQDLEKMLSAMIVGTSRIREIVLSLRNFSRMDEAEQKSVDIHDGIESTLMILQHRLKAKSDRPAINVVRQYDALPNVECFAGQLNQVFMNVLANSIDALETELTLHPEKQKQPVITIRTENRPSSVVISLADNGTGIPEAVRSRIFDPFFTTKTVGKGTGMGMAISYQLVTETHQGKIECFSDEGRGTEFVIEIPKQLVA